MRTFTAELTAELVKETRFIRHLFIFHFAADYHYTDCDQDIYYGGNQYLARGIKFDPIELTMMSKVPTTTIILDDTDLVVSTILRTQNIADKIVEVYWCPLDMNLQVLGAIGDSNLMFYGRCNRGQKQRGSNNCEIEIQTDYRLWKRLTPRRTCSPTCPWDFKHGPSKVLGTNGSTYTFIGDQEQVADLVTKPITGGSWATIWSLAGSGGVTWVQYDWHTPGTCRYSGSGTWCDKSWDRCVTLGNSINFGGFRWLTGLQEKTIYWGRHAPK